MIRFSRHRYSSPPLPFPPDRQCLWKSSRRWRQSWDLSDPGGKPGWRSWLLALSWTTFDCCNHRRSETAYGRPSVSCAHHVFQINTSLKINCSITCHLATSRCLFSFFVILCLESCAPSYMLFPNTVFLDLKSFTLFPNLFLTFHSKTLELWWLRFQGLSEMLAMSYQVFLFFLINFYNLLTYLLFQPYKTLTLPCRSPSGYCKDCSYMQSINIFLN